MRHPILKLTAMFGVVLLCLALTVGRGAAQSTDQGSDGSTAQTGQSDQTGKTSANAPANRGAESAESTTANGKDSNAAEQGDSSQAEARVSSEGQSPPNAFTRFWLRLRQAGWIGVVLGLLSVLAIAVAIERFVQMRRKHIVPDNVAMQADQLAAKGDFSALERLAEDQPSTLTRVIAALVAHRSVEPGEARVIANEVGSAELKLHQQRTYFLAVVGTLAPLLGLLGTVIGLIGAFEAIAMVGSMGDPSIFAEDIGLALMTTAMGLIVAIPVMALNHWFKSRLNRYAVTLEQQVTELIRRWFGPDGRFKQPAAANADSQIQSKANTRTPAQSRSPSPGEPTTSAV